jgi:hypothetical protein
VSLLDVILNQKIIIISIATAMLPLLVAILLALASNLRQFNLARKAHRKHTTAQRVSDLLVDAPLSAPVPVLPVSGSEPKRPAAAPQPLAPSVAAKQPPQTEQPAGGAQRAEGQQETENAVPAAMQDILSSVFADDETLDQFDVLLEGTDRVEVSQLLIMCNQIEGQLRAASAAAEKS